MVNLNSPSPFLARVTTPVSQQHTSIETKCTMFNVYCPVSWIWNLNLFYYQNKTYMINMFQLSSWKQRFYMSFKVSNSWVTALSLFSDRPVVAEQFLVVFGSLTAWLCDYYVLLFFYSFWKYNTISIILKYFRAKIWWTSEKLKASWGSRLLHVSIMVSLPICTTPIQFRMIQVNWLWSFNLEYMNLTSTAYKFLIDNSTWS